MSNIITVYHATPTLFPLPFGDTEHDDNDRHTPTKRYQDVRCRLDLEVADNTSHEKDALLAIPAPPEEVDRPHN
jgi:hypothetical protein